MAVKFFQWCGVAGLHPSEKKSVRHVWYALQWLVFLISIWLIVQFYLDINGFINANVRIVLLWVFWAVFLCEIIAMLCICKHKLYYLFSNWLIILVMLAAFPILWYFAIYVVMIRFFQALVILVLLLPWASVSAFLAQNYLGWFILFFVFISAVFGLLLGFMDPGIGGPWLGIWWAFQTITLVGYGDPTPQTVLGQVFSIIIMLLGVLLVALISAAIVSYFFRKLKGAVDLEDIDRRLKQINKQLEKQNKTTKNSKKSKPTRKK